uniref:Uncharacterized protein n=1 Tax=Anguilla anguilla TaxID=7936 RepID=A0A0E9W9J5_ANGAN
MIFSLLNELLGGGGFLFLFLSPHYFSE